MTYLALFGIKNGKCGEKKGLLTADSASQRSGVHTPGDLRGCGRCRRPLGFYL